MKTHVVKFTGAGVLPVVRFGSTETCLQVAGTPLSMSAGERLAAMEAGWRHSREGVPTCGYYVGRDHAPLTEVRVVRSVDTKSPGYLQDCEPGEPGQIVQLNGVLVYLLVLFPHFWVVP